MRNVKGHKQPRTPRRAAQFWAPLNNWWRAYLAEHNRRPATSELQEWYNENAEAAWTTNKPSWKEARIHAKCLRSTEQVKNYFREYRARGKQASEGKQEAGVDNTSFEDGPSGLQVGQGGPDTLNQLVSSHNARIAQINSISGLGPSPFATPTPQGLLFPSPAPSRASPALSAPVWQHGRAASERFNIDRRQSILDSQGPSLADRSVSFGSGATGLTSSLAPSLLERPVRPFSPIDRDRQSCPQPHGLDTEPTWENLHQGSSASPRTSSFVQGQQVRKPDTLHPGTLLSPTSPPTLRFSRSFGAPGVPLPRNAGPAPSSAPPQPRPLGQDTILEWRGSGPVMRSQHQQAFMSEHPTGGLDVAGRRELLRMVAQDALIGPAAASTSLAAATRQLPGGSDEVQRATAGLMQPSRRLSGAPGRGTGEDLTELWALAEDEPSAVTLPMSSSMFLQDHAQLVSLHQPDRLSATSDPGPTQLPGYLRSSSFPPLLSARTSCLSTDIPVPPGQNPREHFTLLSAYHQNLMQDAQRPSLLAQGSSSSAGMLRRCSDSTAQEGIVNMPVIASRTSVPTPGPLILTHDFSRPARRMDNSTEISQGWARGHDSLLMQQQQQQQQQHQQRWSSQTPSLQNLRVNSSRVPLSEREKQEMEQQQLLLDPVLLPWSQHQQAQQTQTQQLQQQQLQQLQQLQQQQQQAQQQQQQQQQAQQQQQQMEVPMPQMHPGVWPDMEWDRSTM